MFSQFKMLKDGIKKLKSVGISPVILSGLSLLAVVAALFEGISMGLLIPTVKGVIEKDFGFAGEVKGLGLIIRTFPETFKGNASIFILLIFLLFTFSILKNIFAYIATAGSFFYMRRAGNNLRKTIYARYLSFGKLFYDQNNIGHLHQILMGFTEQFASVCARLETGLFSFFSLMIYLAIMFVISWKLTLFVLLVFPILHYALRNLIERIKKTSKLFSTTYSEIGKKISNALTCIPLVKSYTNEEKEKEWFSFSSDRIEKLQFSMDKKQLLVHPLQEIIILCMVLLLVGFMAYLVIREKTGEVASLMVFFLLLRRATQAAGFYNYFKSIFAMLAGPARELENIFSNDGKYFIPDGEKKLDAFERGIELRGLNFSFPNGLTVLKDMSLFIEKGKMTALVGPSGSGKTTLINLILRFYDSPPGTIFIGSTDIREFSLASLRKKMALVSQETYLFNASFKINLTYGLQEEISDEDIINVLKRACLYDVVMRWPEQLATEIGDRGIRLSGGEKQRLSIARAMLKKAEIIILDEATSALDSATEQQIQIAIDEAVKGRTAIVVAHRLSTIKHADKIVVIENGTIAEEGALSELLAKKSSFFKYWEAQKFF